MGRVQAGLKPGFAMVRGLHEEQGPGELLREYRAELKNDCQQVAKRIEIRIMIEILAAVVMAFRLARKVDFFSIGTNDLVKSRMATDRTRAHVAPLVTGFHSPVLRLVRDTTAAAHDRGDWVGLCSELRRAASAIAIALRIGPDEFNMIATAIPLARQTVAPDPCCGQ